MGNIFAFLVGAVVFVAVFRTVWKYYRHWFQSKLDRVTQSNADQRVNQLVVSVGCAVVASMIVFGLVQSIFK